MRLLRSSPEEAASRGEASVLTPSSGRRAFTLLEVILAVTIATGILVAMLAFYNQAANIRGQLLQEAERLTTIRLLLDRLTADLRSARADVESGQGLSGEENSLQVLRVDLPPLSGWAKSGPNRSGGAFTDLKVVSYGVSSRMDGTNMVVAGLVRTEHPLVQQKVIESGPAPPIEPGGTTTVPDNEQEPEAKRGPEPLTDAVGFLYFRFWDGSGWVKSWKDLELPQGVEVTLGAEPASAGTTPEDYPFEMFRRVVYLPGHASSQGLIDESVFGELDSTTEVAP